MSNTSTKIEDFESVWLKMFRLKVIVLAGFLLLIVMPIINNTIICNAQVQVEKTGTYFEIKNSEYLNVTLESSEEVEIVLESIPKMISLDIESVDNSIDFTELTLTGLESSKTYYKYEDSHRNLIVFNSGESGIYSWTQEINQPHHIWIQETKSTIYLPEECYKYGTWDSGTKTCILNQNLTESVEIEADGVTLDCDGHSITGSGSGSGIYLFKKKNVNIKNCNVNNFNNGFYVYEVSHGIFSSNTLTSNYYGAWFQSVSCSEVVDNVVSFNEKEGLIFLFTSGTTVAQNEIYETINSYFGGIRLSYSDNNILKNNKISKVFRGIGITRSFFNEVIGNTIELNQEQGIFVQYSSNNIIIENKISKNHKGISVETSPGNKIYHNNFINNDQQVTLWNQYEESFFDNGYPDGGNYWDDYSGIDLYSGFAQGQIGSDSIGDTPYIFNGGQDNYPFMVENGWEISEPVCGNGICEEGETFENCYQDCAEEGIEKYFPYYKFSYGEEYYPVSFYFDNDADVENNKGNYEARTGDWENPYVYAHTVEDDDYFTIQYWKYEVFNKHRIAPIVIQNHDHDWDATVFVVFKKNDFSQPTEVRFARHIYIGVYDWDEIEKEETTHPVVYVAKGSHGGYISQNMGSLDEFESGGITYSPDIFNYYRVGYCSEIINKDISGKQREFCLVKNKLLKGEAQNEPADGYWSNRFEGNFISPKAPWNPEKDKWYQTRPEGAWSILEFGVDCPVDLHIYDSENRHVGINYDTNEPEIEIPEAVFRKEGEKQYIMIPNPMKGDYRVEIIGTGDGEYDFAMLASEDMKLIEAQEKENIPITEGEVQTFIVVGLWEIPKEIKKEAVTDLESIENNNRIIKKNIQKAIDLINKSLDEKYWLDDSHLDQKQGKKVFNYELRAVARLKLVEKLNKKFKDDQVIDTVKKAVEKLTKADYLLAKVAVDETKEIEIENNRFKKIIEKFITKAEKELVKANEDLENDELSKSINHSKKSWHFSQQAIKLNERYNN